MTLVKFVAFTLACFQLASCQRCSRAISRCLITDPDTGLPTRVDYDNCQRLCCGGELVERDVYIQCCGTELTGVTYDSSLQVCCAWPFGEEYNLYDIGSNGSPACCGSALIPPRRKRAVSCCGKYDTRPETFNHFRAMCCEGIVTAVDNTAFTSCCGDRPYDRRFASCPCNDDVIAVGIPDRYAKCCYTGGRRTYTPYNGRTQGCCNGVVFNQESQFCCGGLVGNSSTQVCCGNIIGLRSSDVGDSNFGCCRSRSGEIVAYNLTSSICCRGVVLDRTAVQDGDSCCGDVVYSSRNSVCCRGVVYRGDGCCSGIGYLSSAQICCGGFIQPHNFVTAACCGINAYDASSQTCCGLSIFANPRITDDEGRPSVSRHTRCCGNVENPFSLRPYDYLSDTCCAGVIRNLNGVPWAQAQCCGNRVLDVNNQLCCTGNLVANIYGASGVCCGAVVVNSSITLCCNGVPQPDSDDNICCGTSAINLNEELCCGGVSRSLNGVPRENAICCGDGCIDGSLYWCCDGKQYQKGVTGGADVSGLDCTDLFTGK